MFLVSAILLTGCAPSAIAPLQFQKNAAHQLPAQAVVRDAAPPGALPPQHEHRNFDARVKLNKGARFEPSQRQTLAIEALRAELPELSVTFEHTTGATRTLWNRSGYLTAPDGRDALDISLQYILLHHELLGLAEEDLGELELTDRVPSAVTGATHLYFRQTHLGLALYGGQLQVHVNRDGRILSVNNACMPRIAEAVNTATPMIDAAGAVALAADHTGLAHHRFPTTTRPAAGPRQETGVSAAGISAEPVTAQLVWLPVQGGIVRLAWNFQVFTLDSEHVYDFTVDATDGYVWTRFDWVAADTYRVYAMPAESPNHVSPTPPSDGRTLLTDPAHSTGSPLAWHDTGSTTYTIPRGNNVHAYEDSNGNNSPPGSQPDGGSSHDFDFSIDLTQSPSTYRPAAVANLFYWNNIIHDVQYLYGFDEAGGNFQVNNFGNGGAGNDDVRAEAQDGGGSNNANFLTLPDGQRPRMQMYLWTAPNPDIDGDFDNGIVIHEYGHGISIRQVGGPSNTSVLNNNQQPGEGWSDWLSLAYTAETGDQGTDVRGIGTYALNEPTSGTGIRGLPYSTDQSVNNWTYESISGMSIPHGVGSVWAQAIWEVYWALVDTHGFDADLYNVSAGAGNHRAMLYVNEGLKNTPTSPTFTDCRDAILQVATDNYGGADVCLMWDAFAAYGLGTDAVSGSSNSTNPTNGFATPASCQCSPSPSANAGADVSICQGEFTTIGTAAQPSTTYSWSPGGETAAQIAVSPTSTTNYTVTATTTCGSAQDSVVVTVDTGAGGGMSEDFESGAGSWSASGLWHLASSSSCASPGHSSPVNAFYYGQDSTCDYNTGSGHSGTLTSPTIIGITSASTLSFDYYRVVESYNGSYDQTEVDIVSSSGTTTVFALDSSDASTAAWTSSGAISLASYAGQAIQVVFRFDTIDNIANDFTGWFIDDVVVTGDSACDNAAPVVSITSPPNSSSFDEGTVIAFAATANDTEDGDLTTGLGWTSDLDGAIGSGGSFSTTLSVGTHTIQASVTDSGGLGGSDSVVVTVNPNTAPVVTITSPVDGSIFDEGAVIGFAGSASDSQDGDLTAGLAWTSSLDGAIGSGGSFSATLSVGTHTIQASVSDSDGLGGSDSVVVTVAPNTPPTVTISAPADGSVFDEGASISFAGSASDSQDGDLTGGLAWTSSLDGAIGSGGSFSATLSVGTHTIQASVSDSGGLGGSDSVVVTVAPNTPPTVTISAPADGSVFDEGASISFAGSASDSQDGDLTGGLAWTSSLDGAIGSGGSFSATLSVGTHTIQASVSDSGGLGGSDSVVVTVAPNTPPTVTISAPADGSAFDEGVSISFAGFASDSQDGTLTAGLVWSSNLDGPIGSGGSFSTTLSVGTHTIQAAVIDSGGLGGSDSIVVTVNDTPNTAPTVAISAPSDGAVFDEGAVIGFAGAASDAEDGDLSASLAWTSSLDGPIGAGGSFPATLSVGTHTIQASVTDSGGLGGSDSIVVSVTANSAPTVAISAPSDGAVFDEGAVIGFAGTASDAEDGDLSASLAWTSSLDGPIGAGASFPATLSVGTHTIQASVTDSGGLGGSDSVVVSVTVNSAPVVTITAPADGASVDEGTAILFAGAAIDAQDGDLSASLAWTSDLDGSIGTGASFSTTLSVGTHTILASATDSGGLAGSDSITVMVVDVTPGGGLCYISFRSTTSVPGLGNVRDEDVVTYDPSTDTWAWYFDGSDVGIGGTDVNALHVLSDGSLVLSFNASSNSIPGLIGGPNGIIVEDSDLVLFTFSSSGSNTSGQFQFVFDGSDVGLTTNGEDIDGVYEFPGGGLAISTRGGVKVPGTNGKDEDVLLFLPDMFGAATSGTWSMYFDGSDAGFASNSGEDLNAITFENGVDLLFSTAGSWSASGGSGDDEDIGRFSGNFGSSTSGSASLEFDFSALGIATSEDIDGFCFVAP
jgi:extracellular elastinolytic metalloproteinase